MALSPLVERMLRSQQADSAPMGMDAVQQPQMPALKPVMTTTPQAPAGGGGGFSGNVQQAVMQAAAQRGWTGAQWNALKDLIQKESSWNPNISNPSSGAFGLFQFMPMHWKPGGYLPNGTQSSLQQQIEAGLRYIADRYKTPQGALNHWLAAKPINGQNVGHWY